MTKEQMLQLLRKDVVPALGCTEPVSVALCAAQAGAVLQGIPEYISIEVNPGIYKNTMSAGIPGCSMVGIPWAVAIGAFLKNPEKQLQLLEDITPEILKSAEKLIADKKVSVSIKDDEKSIYIKCTLHSGTEEVVSITRNSHTNLVHLSRNSQVLYQNNHPTAAAGGDPLVADLKEMAISEIRQLVSTATEDELAFMMDGVLMNESLATYSQQNPIGVGLAQSLQSDMAAAFLGEDNLMRKITYAVTSAAESRLDGCPLPTMSSSGAGTKGLVVILPISETAKAIGASLLTTLQAIALGHLINRYCNAYVGKLSPMCSCVMCSSTAAAAGIAFLLGGSDQQIGNAIRNMCGTVTGMICDGGKVGCAMKVAIGSFAALNCALQAIQGVALRVSDGICAETPEQCIRNMAAIGIHGMSDTDREILHLMRTCK